MKQYVVKEQFKIVIFIIVGYWIQIKTTVRTSSLLNLPKLGPEKTGLDYKRFDRQNVYGRKWLLPYTVCKNLTLENILFEYNINGFFIFHYWR